MKYIMALDQGTTSSRCILFDHAGNICASVQKEFRQIFPQPGWVEHNAAEIWDTTLEVSRAAMDKLGVTAADIAWVVSARTGIPVGRLTARERERLLNLEELLSAHVMGQSKAVQEAAEAVRRGFSGLRDARRPIACLLFAGPTMVFLKLTTRPVESVSSPSSMICSSSPRTSGWAFSSSSSSTRL